MPRKRWIPLLNRKFHAREADGCISCPAAFYKVKVASPSEVLSSLTRFPRAVCSSCHQPPGHSTGGLFHFRNEIFPALVTSTDLLAVLFGVKCQNQRPKIQQTTQPEQPFFLRRQLCRATDPYDIGVNCSQIFALLDQYLFFVEIILTIC